MKRKILSLAIGAAIVAGTTSASSLTELRVQQNPHFEKVNALPEGIKEGSFANAVKLGQGRIGVIIQLEDAPLAMFEPVNPALSGKSSASRKLADNLKSSAAKEYQSYLARKQKEFVSMAKSVDKSFVAGTRFDSLINGMAASVDKNKVRQLMNLPGVKAVYPEQVRRQMLDESLDIVGARQVWEALGGSSEAGRGIRVAVVDSGIRPENPLFSGEGFTAPENLPDDDYCSLVDPDFCNDKLIVARAATVTEEDIALRLFEGEFPNSPLAYNGHGTHVAGIAVGNSGVTATIGENFSETISGVAPAAYLMKYKGLYTSPANPTSGSGLDRWLIEMLEAAIEDGADVINNSWGGGAGNAPRSIYDDVFSAANAAGAVVVFAAGNDGPGPQTIGCPSCNDETLTVGATTTSRYQVDNFSAPDAGVENVFTRVSGPVSLTEDISDEILYAGQINDGSNFEGCSAWEDPETFTGSWALISRGSCTFADKISNAQDAGATGVVIFNNVPGDNPFFMAGIDDVATVPAAMISFENGIKVAEFLLAGETELSATLIAGASTPDAVAFFSSRGPNGDPSFLKPNLVAPGQSILSAESPVPPETNGATFGFKSGTSMASPHVAGAAALVKQANPDWTPEQIMSALTNTAVREGLIDFDLSTGLTPFDIGAGRLDIPRAMAAELTYSELGLANSACFNSCSFTFTVTNTSDSDVTVDMTDFMLADGVTIETFPGDATLPSGSETEITVTVNTSAALNQNEWAFGGIEWDDGNADTPEYYLPIAVKPIASENSNLISTINSDSVVAADETVTVSTTVQNTSFVDTIEIVGTFDASFEIASVAATARNEAATATVDETANTVTWTGTLGATEFGVTPSTKYADDLALFGLPSYTPLAAVGATPASCPDADCDEFQLTRSIPTFTYLGTEYDSITISDNGIVTFGSNSDFGTAFFAQDLPDPNQPNNLVAPFWADFDLNNGDAEDTGTGEIYAGFLNLPAFGCATCGAYYVVEWNNVQPWNIPGESYSFQVIFEIGANNVYFNYGAIGSTPTALAATSSATVGAEGPNGAVGFNAARVGFDGSVTGTLPEAGDLWLVGATLGETATISVDGSLESRSALITDAGTLDEDGSVNIDVLTNDLDRTIVNTFEVTSGGTSARSLAALTYDLPALDTTSLAIDTAPANGTAEVTGGVVSYTPTADFNGIDSFTYSVTDAEGVVSTETVNVTVNAVDDVPTFSISAPASTIEGGFFTVSVNATDPDTVAALNATPDTLTVTINGAQTTSLRVEAPQVGPEGSVLTYDVVVTDGTTTLNGSVSVTVRDIPPSSGSLAWYTMLLLPLTFLRRRKKLH